MHEVTQTILHDPPKIGNCFQAALASVLELPIDDVPHFMLHGDWFLRLQGWLADRGLCYLYDVHPQYSEYWGYHLISGLSERGVRHTCVGRAGALVFDPHPSRAGLLPEGDEHQLVFSLLVPLDPAIGEVHPETLTPSRKSFTGYVSPK